VIEQASFTDAEQAAKDEELGTNSSFPEALGFAIREVQSFSLECWSTRHSQTPGYLLFHRRALRTRANSA